MTPSETPRRIALLLAVAASLTALSWTANAAEPVSQQVPPVDSCMTTIKTMGSSMGYAPSTGADGRPLYTFILRSAGVDYDAVCDATSGIVKDVTPRPIH